MQPDPQGLPVAQSGTAGQVVPQSPQQSPQAQLPQQSPQPQVPQQAPQVQPTQTSFTQALKKAAKKGLALLMRVVFFLWPFEIAHTVLAPYIGPMYLLPALAVVALYTLAFMKNREKWFGMSMQLAAVFHIILIVRQIFASTETKGLLCHQGVHPRREIPNCLIRAYFCATKRNYPLHECILFWLDQHLRLFGTLWFVLWPSSLRTKIQE
jgi:hypothetical protein